ncbi:MAG: hypothetical protein V4622_05795 [Bacteroidota bacterium]
MKKVILSIFVLISGISLFSCKKYNDEDPWFSHGGKHLNERLEGEWELVSLHIIEEAAFPFDKDEEYEDFSNLLDIDTMNIAKFFKFVPKEEDSDVEGNGELLIRSKSMSSYPEKIGIGLSNDNNINDTNVALAKLKYLFREGSKNGISFFQFKYIEVDTIDSLTPDIPCFKPFDEYFLFNNFFKYIYTFEIAKATKKELILYYNVQLIDNNPSATYRRYRLTFKKIK